jgi:hypothetical protein
VATSTFWSVLNVVESSEYSGYKSRRIVALNLKGHSREHGDDQRLALFAAPNASRPLDEDSLEQFETHEWLGRSPRSKGRTRV